MVGEACRSAVRALLGRPDKMSHRSAGSGAPGTGGVVLVDKNRGSTSHDAVLALRRVLRIRSVGHTGTLDPMATGLLLLPVGAATKLCPYLSRLEKEYLGTVVFGVITDSFDATGRVLERRQVEGSLEPEALRREMESMTGEIDQVPPMASAVKVDGVRLHRLARRGLEVERKARKVKVFSFELIDCRPDSADFRVVCSSGTYVRSLVAELGQRLGCGGHLGSLRRTRIGRFEVDGALKVEAMEEEGAEGILSRRLIPAAEAVDFLSAVVLDEDGLRILRNGGQPPQSSVLDWKPALEAGHDVIRVLNERGELCALGAATDLDRRGLPRGIRPVRVLVGSG